MKTNQVILHAIEISNQNEFSYNHSTFHPSVYRRDYHATLQGNIVTLQHKEYEHIVSSFVISYDMSRELAKAFNNSFYLAQAYRIIQRVVQLKTLQLVKEVNRGV